MIRELQIYSYFSLPTDLAAEMRDWPEFVRGQDYDVELCSSASGEAVTVQMLQEEEGAHFVRIFSATAGPLFDRVTGRAIYALSQHSDDLMVERNPHPNAA